LKKFCLKCDLIWFCLFKEFLFIVLALSQQTQNDCPDAGAQNTTGQQVVYVFAPSQPVATGATDHSKIKALEDGGKTCECHMAGAELIRVVYVCCILCIVIPTHRTYSPSYITTIVFDNVAEDTLDAVN